MLDTAHAKACREASDRKINFHYLLECQNGNDYGPRSIKGNPVQIHAPTTNFGMLLLGQADCVHDFWGQVFVTGSPLRSKGFEGRPLFLFAGPARLCQKEQLISGETIYAFLKAVLLKIATTVGHQIKADFIRKPLKPDDPNWWRILKQAAAQAEEDAPACTQLAAAKWGYTCGSRIICNQLLSISFASLPRSEVAIRTLLQGGQDHGVEVEPAGETPVPQEWQRLEAEAFIAAPRFLSMCVGNLRTIFGEMNLAPVDRAGTKAAAMPKPASSAAASALQVLAKTLQKHQRKQYLYISDVKPHLNSKHRDQAHYEEVFALAQHAGRCYRRNLPGHPTKPLSFEA